MRLLSRVPGVLLALVLLGASLMTLSACIVSDTFSMGDAVEEPATRSNSFATATFGPGAVVHIVRKDTGEELTVRSGGYLRQADSGDGRGGQTYRIDGSDGDIVRRWLAPDDPEVRYIPWALLIESYTVPEGVLALIPLDDKNPVPYQLVQAFGDDRVYVFTPTGGWRWIPDLATFTANGFYWCDVSTGDAEFFTRVMKGDPLPLRAEVPNHPGCHNA